MFYGHMCVCVCLCVGVCVCLCVLKLTRNYISLCVRVSICDRELCMGGCVGAGACAAGEGRGWRGFNSTCCHTPDIPQNMAIICIDYYAPYQRKLKPFTKRLTRASIVKKTVDVVKAFYVNNGITEVTMAEKKKKK